MNLPKLLAQLQHFAPIEDRGRLRGKTKRRHRIGPDLLELERRDLMAVGASGAIGEPRLRVAGTADVRRIASAAAVDANATWLRETATVVLTTPVPEAWARRTAQAMAHGLGKEAALFQMLRTPTARAVMTQAAYGLMLGRSGAPLETRPFLTGPLRNQDMWGRIVALGAGEEYWSRSGGTADGFRAAVSRDVLGGLAPPERLLRAPVGTPGQRRQFLWRVVGSTPFHEVWSGRVADIALGGGEFDAGQLARATRGLGGRDGYSRSLAHLLATPASQADVQRRAHPIAPTSGPSSTSRFAVNRQWLVPDPITDPIAWGGTPGGATAGATVLSAASVGRTPGVPVGSPWGNAVVFPEVSYGTIMAGATSVPTLQLPAPASSLDAAGGFTFQAWFQAKTPGILLSVPLSLGGTPSQAPLVYINDAGKLAAGAFDQTPLNLDAGSTLVSWTDSGGAAQIGADVPIVSQSGVVDNTWHHVALVVTAESQSLYVDGLLQGTLAPDDGRYGLLPTASTGVVATLAPSTVPTVGGSIVPESAANPYPQLNFPQGFIGTVDEVALWDAPLTQVQVQAAMTAPIGTQDDAALLPSPTGLPTPLGGPDLLAYFDFNATGSTTWANAAPGGQGEAEGPTLISSPTTIPTDPFPEATRLAGSRDWGLDVMFPLASSTVSSLAAGATTAYKAGLAAGDQLVIGVPDSLDGTLRIVVVDDIGRAQSSTLPAGGTASIQATRTGTYRISLTWTPAAGQAVATGTATFSLVPGPLNSVMELFTSYKQAEGGRTDYLYAYADPDLPGINSTVGTAGATGPASYWPLWSDAAYFPAADFSASQLNAAYQTLQALMPAGVGLTNLIGGTVTNPSQIQNSMGAAYLQAAGVAPPRPPAGSPTFGGTALFAAPSDPSYQAPATAIEAVYQFLYNANVLRQQIYATIVGDGVGATSLLGWVLGVTQGIPTDISTQIAATIAEGQDSQITTLPVTAPDGSTDDSPSQAGKVASILADAALAAVGGFLTGDSARPQIADGAIDGSISLASSMMGAAGVPATQNLTVSVQPLTNDALSYQTLSNIASSINTAVLDQWNAIYLALDSDAFIQSILSNYGLILQASRMDAQVLGNPAIFNPTAATAPVLEAASWQTMIPATFHWATIPPYDFPFADAQSTDLNATSLSLQGPDGAIAVTTGDFNNDTYTDVAVANNKSSDLSILLGLGDGSFSSPTTVGLDGPDGVAGIVTGDFNGDGTADLAVANSSSSDVSILLGSGDGSFPSATTVGLDGPDGAWGIAAGDFDGDGDLDLAVTNSSQKSNSLSVLFNNGSGGFQVNATYGLGDNTNPEGIVAADFDGDGLLDLVTANPGADNLSILLGLGGGTFANPTNLSTGGSNPKGLAYGDFDEDGDLDLAVTNYGGNSLGVLLNAGGGNFQTLTTYPLGGGLGPLGVAVMDANVDGVPDLAVADNQSDSMSIFVAQTTVNAGGRAVATGAFLPALTYVPGFTDGEYGFDGPAGVAAAPFNTTGSFSGLFVANQYSSNLAVLSGKTVGNFPTFLPGVGSANVQAADAAGQLGAALGKLQWLQGSKAVSFGPSNSTALIQVSNQGYMVQPPFTTLPGGSTLQRGTYPPNYMAYISTPYFPATGALTIASPGAFWSMTPATMSQSVTSANLGTSDSTTQLTYNQSGSLLSGWYLFDKNNNPMAQATTQQLFGLSYSHPATLTPLDASRPVVGLNGGWYAANRPAGGAVTTWADVFFAWGRGTTGYAPASRSLVPPTTTPGTKLPDTATFGELENIPQGQVAIVSGSETANLTYSLSATAALADPPAASSIQAASAVPARLPQISRTTRKPVR